MPRFEHPCYPGLWGGSFGKFLREHDRSLGWFDRPIGPHKIGVIRQPLENRALERRAVAQQAAGQCYRRRRSCREPITQAYSKTDQLVCRVGDDLAGDGISFSGRVDDVPGQGGNFAGTRCRCPANQSGHRFGTGRFENRLR